MKLIPAHFNNDIVEGYTVYDENMEYYSGVEDIVLSSRKKLASILNTDIDHMVAPQQRHTTHFQEVTLSDGGIGQYPNGKILESTDAIYTKDKGLVLMTFHADCIPVLLFCDDIPLIAAIHSGWRGTVNEIVYKVTSHLISNEHVDSSHIHAYIGPSIEYDHFEAMDDIVDLVKKMSFDTTSFYKVKDKDHYLVNLKGLVKQQLLNLGVLDQHIEVSPICTLENKEFYSYRRDKTNNRCISIIKLKG